MKNDIEEIMYILKMFTKNEPNYKKSEFGEQEASSGGGGGGGGSKSPYPTVTKWASGRKFGPTYNPEQKVWASGVTRGKSNTLL